MACLFYPDFPYAKGHNVSKLYSRKFFHFVRARSPSCDEKIAGGGHTFTIILCMTQAVA